MYAPRDRYFWPRMAGWCVIWVVMFTVGVEAAVILVVVWVLLMAKLQGADINPRLRRRSKVNSERSLRRFQIAVFMPTAFLLGLGWLNSQFGLTINDIHWPGWSLIF